MTEIKLESVDEWNIFKTHFGALAGHKNDYDKFGITGQSSDVIVDRKLLEEQLRLDETK